MYVTTGRDMLRQINDTSAYWIRQERLLRRLARWPIVGRWFRTLWIMAWQEVEYVRRVNAYVAKVGAENVSGMDLTIVGLGVPKEPTN